MAGEQVHFSTNVGDFSVELYPSYAPRTCKNFSELCARALRPTPSAQRPTVCLATTSVFTERVCARSARRGYYDGTIFHRIIKDFMIQGGDPTGTGKGGERCVRHPNNTGPEP